ncbi:MAG: phage capsid protein [Rhodospirillales bacterium]
MAGETSGAYFTANAVVDKTAAGTFIPEIWSDEVIAAYQKNLKMAPLVKRLAMTGKKGDVIHIPKPVRGTANAKAEAVAVTIQANLESELTVTVDRHFEYSRLIEDIVEVQALSSLRQFYTEDAGYQLALKVDTDLINAATGFGDGTRTATPTDASSWANSNAYYVNASSGLAAYAADTVATGDNFTDLALREAIKLMDDADVPMDGRVLVIPPAARKSIMGIDRYVSSDFVGGRGVESGLIGNLYGVDVYVSSNAPTLETAAQNAGGSIDVRGCLFFHKDALVMAEQMAVRSQTQYKQEYLSTLYTADTLYGVETYRPEAGFIIAIADE